ncbi:MAG: hypothetical protein KKA07_10230 [Bacteroidetes bacterium]|nr:hypothetical protein [Bacteroidota bacterium]MBU1719438.1 hypothetical protein [Bacteroidota bacterium]
MSNFFGTATFAQSPFSGIALLRKPDKTYPPGKFNRLSGEKTKVGIE